MEAWFLTDLGICRWLGVAPAATTDTIRDPKTRVAQAFDRITGRPYRKRRARMEVARQSTGLDGNRNASLREALAAVAQCLTVERRPKRRR